MYFLIYLKNCKDLCVKKLCDQNSSIMPEIFQIAVVTLKTPNLNNNLHFIFKFKEQNLIKI